MGRLKVSIIKTLCYSDLFDFPLTESELWRRLIAVGPSIFRKKSLNLALRELISQKILEKDQNLFFLKERGEIVQWRLKRKRISQKKKGRLKKIVGCLKKMPAVKMIGLTGALAVDNSGKDDDVDLLIITSANRLWLMRLWATFLGEILGRRRRPKQKKVKDKLCLNMYLDTLALKLPLRKRNLFTAYELIQIKPLVNKEMTYERFLAANNWIKTYLPNAIIPSEFGRVKPKKSFLDIFNKWAFYGQSWYMRNRRTRENVSLHAAFFHPQDRAREILNRFKRKCRCRFLGLKEV